MPNLREERMKSRIGVVRATIKKAISKNGDCSYEKIVAECMLNFPCARRTAMEYVNLVLTTDNYERIGDLIVPTAKELTDEEQQLLIPE